MALQSLTAFTTWLAATPLSTLMGEVGWIVPAVQSVHIMAIAVLAGSALMVNLRLFGAFGSGESVAAVTHRFLPWLWWALLGLLVTGGLMVVSEPSRALQNATFLFKMALVAAAVGVTAVIQVPLTDSPGFWERRTALGRWVAVVSMSLWVAVIFCGRWIAYTQDM